MFLIWYQTKKKYEQNCTTHLTSGKNVVEYEYDRKRRIKCFEWLNRLVFCFLFLVLGDEKDGNKTTAPYALSFVPSHQNAEEDYNAYFADLCGEISPRKNRQMLYLWYRFRLLTEEAGEFEGILAGEEGEAFAGTKEARYWLRGMYEELLEWGERYNAELMETAWLIYERHLMICAEPRHEISSPYGEMLSCGVPMAVLFFLYVVMRRGGMPCEGHACGERSCGEGHACGERHACGEGASSAGHACGKPPQKQTDVQERDDE